MPDFMSDLAVRLIESAYCFQSDNHDVLRFPESRDGFDPANARLSAKVVTDAARLSFFHKSPEERQAAIEMMGWMRELAGPLNFTYGLLGDEHSRRMLVDVMAYRVLGPRQVRLARNDGKYRDAVASLSSLMSREKTVPVALLDGWLNRYDLRPIGFPIEADLHPLNILYTFLLQQYRYDRGGVVIQTGQGDFAIDGGGCWGDTAMYLAHQVGPEGRVYCFEFSPDNLPTLERNLELNRSLRERVRLERHALWSASDAQLSFNPAGPGTFVGNQQGAYQVATLSIDDLVERQAVPRVDFIKMDIEGAELEALKGAERTIRTHKPKLAVTLYHRLGDFVTIPRWLHDLKVGYRFFLDHFSINQEETVLFGIAE